MPYKYPSLRTTLPVAGWCASKDTGAAATDQFTTDGTNNGTLTNGATRSGSPLAYSLDGVNDFINVTDAAALRPADGLTVSFWMSASNVTGPKYLVDHSSNSPFFGYAVFLSGNKIGVNAAYNSNAQEPLSVTSIVANTMTHVAVTYDKSNIRIYINGILDRTQAATGAMIYTVTQDLKIGQRATGTTGSFGGLIDDILIYPIALSATNVGYLASQRGAIYAQVADGGLINSQSLVRPAGDYRPQSLVVM